MKFFMLIWKPNLNYNNVQYPKYIFKTEKGHTYFTLDPVASKKHLRGLNKITGINIDGRDLNVLNRPCLARMHLGCKHVQ